MKKERKCGIATVILRYVNLFSLLGYPRSRVIGINKRNKVMFLVIGISLLVELLMLTLQRE